MKIAFNRWWWGLRVRVITQGLEVLEQGLVKSEEIDWGGQASPATQLQARWGGKKARVVGGSLC